jgi:hypothetical protein
MVPGLAEVQNLAPQQIEQTVSGVQLLQELGGILGRLVLAILAVRIASQRLLVRIFLGSALIFFPWVFFFAATHSLRLLILGIFIASLVFNALHSFWGTYLPRIFPTYLRGTGESFEVPLKTHVAMARLMDSRGIDRRYGRLLFGRLCAQGLVSVAAEARVFMWQGGSPGTSLMRANFEQLRREILDAGYVTAEEFRLDLARLNDADFLTPSPILWAAWGRRSPE